VPAIAAEGHAAHQPVVAEEGLANAPAAGHVPLDQVPVPGAGDEARAVGAEGDAAHGVFVAQQRRAEGFAVAHPPQAQAAVVAGGGEQAPVGAEGEAGDRFRVADQGLAEGWLVATSQIWAVLSSLPEAASRPSGLKATARTASAWPVRGRPGRAGCRRR
jgi:hypothetical protein